MVGRKLWEMGEVPGRVRRESYVVRGNVREGKGSRSRKGEMYKGNEGL